jgi:hypothetical protein
MIQVLHIGFFTNFGTGNARIPLQNLGKESLTSVCGFKLGEFPSVLARSFLS